MTTAVIGTGNIGGTLGRAFARGGIPTVFGSRHPSDSIAEALAQADVVLLALPAGAVEDFLRTHGPALAGKLVIDAANNIGGAVANHAQLVSELAPEARYARAFNTLGWENFADPPAGASLFFAADLEARAVAEELISAVGLEPVFVGDATATPTVDALFPLWFALVRQNGGNRKLALRILR